MKEVVKVYLGKIALDNTLAQKVAQAREANYLLEVILQ